MKLFSLGRGKARRSGDGDEGPVVTVVHVDAKIINRDSEDKPKRTFVGYSTEDGKEEGFEEVNLGQRPDAVETDAAELYAIDYAMGRFDGREGRFVLLCDNESVVLTLRRPDLKFSSKTKPILQKVWKGLHEENRRFEVRQFPQNRADRLLNAKWNAIKAGEGG